MRIGVIICGNLDMGSGGFLYDRKLVEYLRLRGDEVEVVALPWYGYARSLTLNLSREVPNRLRRLAPDLLIEDELAHPSLFFSNRAIRREIPVPIVSLVHHLRSSEARPRRLNHWYARVERIYLRSVDSFICNSHDTAERVARLAGGNRPFVVATPGRDRFGQVGIDPSRVMMRAHQEGALRIVFLGNVIRRKGLHTLVSALALLRSSSWRLFVAGRLDVDPDYVRSVERQVEDAGLAQQVAFLGSLPDGKVASLLEESHVLAVPSSHEGYGIVYVEAMGFGLPVIAGSHGGAREIVDHGINGLLVSPGDAKGIAEHIRDLVKDRGTLAAMGSAALERFEALPTWEDTGRAVYEFIHQFG